MNNTDNVLEGLIMTPEMIITIRTTTAAVRGVQNSMSLSNSVDMMMNFSNSNEYNEYRW